MLDERYAAAIRHIPLPERMRHLPISKQHKMPVPWFVEWIDGEADFRVMDGRKWIRAVKFDLCWLCGQTLGRFKVFCAGPMCAVNHTSAEPPSHRDCAEYAVKACPFLTKPRMRRNDAEMPDHAIEPGGLMIPRNPGVTLLWVTHDYRVIKTGGGPIIKMGEPIELVAYAEGRLATRKELNDSITSGLPILAAEAAKDGDKAKRELYDAIAAADAMFKAKLKLAAA